MHQRRRLDLALVKDQQFRRQIVWPWPVSWNQNQFQARDIRARATTER